MITWKDVLGEIVAWVEPIRVKDVMVKWNMQSGEAGVRLNMLRKWGYLRFFDKEKKGYGGYAITDWGKTYAEKLKGEQTPGRVI